MDNNGDADTVICSNSSKKTAFVDFLSKSVEIYDNILSNLSPQALSRLKCANTHVHKVVQNYWGRAFNVNKRLARFFRSPLAFRSLQARTGTVISGSFALQFFDRTYYPESDLDLYVHPSGPVVHDVGLYLESEDYQYQPYSWQLGDFRDEAHRLCEDIDKPPFEMEDRKEYEHMYDMRSIRAVYTFLRHPGPEDSAESTRKVQIIVSRMSPMASMMDFHSTCVMNVITYNAAYSLYPMATFEHQVTLVTNDRAPQAKAALNKYAERGWRAIANPSPLVPYLEPRSFHLDTPRWVCDAHSWTILLDTEGVEPPPQMSRLSDPLARDPIAECGWTLQLVDDAAEMAFYQIATTVLRWRYTAGCEEYFAKLLDFFVCQGRIEHAKLPEGKTPQECADIWVWWDASLPVLRTRFLQEQAKRRALVGDECKLT